MTEERWLTRMSTYVSETYKGPLKIEVIVVDVGFVVAAQVESGKRAAAALGEGARGKRRDASHGLRFRCHVKRGERALAGERAQRAVGDTCTAVEAERRQDAVVGDR